MCARCRKRQKEIYHLEILGVGRRIILKEILKKQYERIWTGFIRLGIGTNGGSPEHSNGPSAFV
jgi:hypothetical protein